MAVLEQMGKLNGKKDKWIAMLGFPVATESSGKEAALICKVLIWQESNYAQKCGAACVLSQDFQNKAKQAYTTPSPPNKMEGGKEYIWSETL